MFMDHDSSQETWGRRAHNTEGFGSNPKRHCIMIFFMLH